MRILICCNAGMSSSILVKNIRVYAEENNIDLVIKALPSSSVSNEVGNWDVCLVAPQLVYAKDRIQSQLQVPVDSIPPLIYATANGKEAYELASKMVAA